MSEAQGPPASESDKTLSLGPAGGPTPREAAKPRILGRFLILSELGRGGMGVVYRAYDPELDRKVALKVLLPAGDVHPPSGEQARARLVREAQAMARLSHPNVIQVYDVGTFDGQVFLALELVEGETLADWLARAEGAASPPAPVPWRAVLEPFTAAGRGLVAAHAAGLVHRDFKPSNVLIGHDGRVRVLDFGIARPVSLAEPVMPERERLAALVADVRLETPLLETPLTVAGQILGTPAFLAPELVFGGDADPRSDQFAFGVALFRALHGVMPFSGRNLFELASAARAGRFVAVPERPRAQRVPVWLDRATRRALAGDPAARFESMEDLLTELTRDHHRGRRRLAYAAGGLLALAALGVLGVTTRRSAEARCAGGESRLAGVWDATAARRLEVALRASGKPYAAAVWQSVRGTLDKYAEGWVTQHREACLQTQRGEQSTELLDLRMACLDRRLLDVKAVVDVLGRAEVDGASRAATAVRELPALATCADTTALLAPMRPPGDAAAVARRAEVDRQLSLARGWRFVGRYAEGLAVATAAVQLARQEQYPPLLAEALQLRANLEEHSGQAERAENSLFEAVTAAEEGRADRLAAAVWSDLVWVVGARSLRFDEGERWAKLAAAAISRAGDDPTQRATLALHRSFVQTSAGNAAAGLAQAQEAVAGFEGVLPAGHPLLGRALNLLAGAQYELGQHAEARATYTRALEQAEAVFGPDHPTVAVRLGNLALTYEAQGDLTGALGLQERALAIEERALGPDHPQVALTRVNLGLLLEGLGRPAEGLAHQERALAIQIAALGPQHPELVATLTNLAGALIAVGRPADAEREARRGLAIAQGSLAADHPWRVAVEKVLRRAQLTPR